MTENMKKYLKLASENKEVQEKFKKINEEAQKESMEAIIKLADKHDIILTDPDFQAEGEETDTMTDNMKKFFEQVSENKEMQDELGSINAQVNEKIKQSTISLAKEQGLALTEADFAQPESEELSDDELDDVAGGVMLDVAPYMKAIYNAVPGWFNAYKKALFKSVPNIIEKHLPFPLSLLNDMSKMKL